ncbi:DUF4399 domain-containing protein [Arenibaculum pallidiluteum]|uniref:DUF4399 domain-containing protein n=1 Tax=Arenibaculum pallidiluteum TaxID=2812559 RepID=UPI001A96EEE0|nr:DUF4399 domain-containing protein [Arenibaculum pallidiluteum]
MKRLVLSVVTFVLSAPAFAQDPFGDHSGEHGDALHAHEVAAETSGQSAGGRQPAPKNARAYIIWPVDGAVIKGGRFWLRMGLQGVGVAPAGIYNPNTGHHHVLIDTDLPPLDEPIPNDSKHLHFGAGQTEARITLPPGRHTLQLLLGDGDHVPHDPPVMSQRITVTVP